MKTTLLILLSLITINSFGTEKNLNNEEFFLEEEAYVDDIPFNTCEIATIYFMEQAMAVEFTIEDEETVNDLPFDTKEISQRLSEAEDDDKSSDLMLPVESNVKYDDVEYKKASTTTNVRSYIVGILLIILMSAYSVTTFLL